MNRLGAIVVLVLLSVAGCGAGTRLYTADPPTSSPPPPGPVCAATSNGHVPAQHVPGPGLVPDSPRQVTICRYSGTKLTKSAPEDATVAAKLAAALNASKPIPRGAYNCPADFGQSAVLVFDYARGPRVDVQLNLTGCEFASNGIVTVNAYTAVAQIVALTGTAR